MGRPRKQIPELRRRKDGRHWCVIDGVHHTLSRDPALARRRFGELLAGAAPPRQIQAPSAPTVGDVLAAWLDARRGKVDARQAARMGEAADCCDPWADLPAGEFHQGHLDAARTLLLARPSKRDGGPLSRTYVNRVVGLVQTCWRWAASRRLVTAAQRDEVCALLPLGPGEGGAERPRRQPADPAAVAAALACLGRVPAAMLRLQLLTGMRPGEVCALRPCDLDREGFEFEGARWWVYRPGRHKTLHRGKARLVVLSPAAQAVLVPYLDRDPSAWCFSPKEADSPKARGRSRNDRYPVESYCQSVQYAQAAARRDLEHWLAWLAHLAGAEPPAVALEEFTPHCCRHLVSTAARDAGASREDTAALLGHATLGMTDHYTSGLLQAAARAAKNLG